MASQYTETVDTRVLILSDTHGMKFGPHWNEPIGKFDVVIHCGDLTEESKLHEFEATIDLLQAIDAPLKLVIAGNHEITLDSATFEKHLAASGLSIDDPIVQKFYGTLGKVKDILSRDPSVRFLEEGTHEFPLTNGARLKVYASPWTPRRAEESTLGSHEAGWAFQYEHSPASGSGHHFEIQERTDVVITHGPPLGLLDHVGGRRVGCPDLFSAVARKRPQLHCFGHIHAGWGAKLVTWRDDSGTESPSHFTSIDNERSAIIGNLSSLRPGKFDDDEAILGKKMKLNHYLQQGFCDVTPETEILEGQTLFANASIEGSDEVPIQPPMVVNLKLPTTYPDPRGTMDTSPEST